MKRVITISSAICLLLTAFSSLLALLAMAGGGFVLWWDFSATFLLGTLATAVTFVASYRQLGRTRPRLVLSGFVFQIAFTLCLSVLAWRVSKDEAAMAFQREIQESINEQIEAGEIDPNLGLQDAFAPTRFDPIDLLYAILIIIVLFAIPMYRNVFRQEDPS